VGGAQKPEAAPDADNSPLPLEEEALPKSASQSDSSSGFSLSLLDSAALRALDESDGLVVVKKKRR
jgi:hypothetical protein